MSLEYKSKIDKLMEKIEQADAILVGVGSGMSAAAGFLHYYERDKEFVEKLGKFEAKYGFHCSFDGFYYRYPTSEERWAYNAAMGCMIMDAPAGQPYYDMREVLQGKHYHILTTNQDTQLPKVFTEDKISAIQGDNRYYQCSHRCHDELYDAIEPAHRMLEAIDEDLKIPSELIPKCPKCGAEMEPWVRSYVFLEGKKYKEEHEKWQKFVVEHQSEKILFLELGVGRMTPMFIQEPFWSLTYNLPNAYYININPKDAIVPVQLKDKGMAIHEDIAKVFSEIKERIK
ncbi:MAG: NAD-dependent protein deacetylase [Lachnospiraceae bacterium]|nr:NAD-dependent protein deacetylase [Lachnospiraceae bacterium]